MVLCTNEGRINLAIHFKKHRVVVAKSSAAQE